MKADFYTHNGHYVLYQAIIVQESGMDFFSQLSESDIVPEELPDPDLSITVFKYYHKGNIRYAAVKTFFADDYFENIYITEFYPDDGFPALIKDIDGQVNGEPPIQQESRLGMICREAETACLAQLAKSGKYGDPELFMYTAPVKDEINAYLKKELIRYGYSKNRLKKIKAVDVDIAAIYDLFDE